MNIRALSFDLARAQRPTLDQLIRVVDGLAELGFNMMTVNLEHRFEFPSAPGVGPRGSLTTHMAQALTAHGKARGVAIVPQPNLIGHCEGIGATERYAHLTADPFQQGPWGGYEQLNLELPEARAMVRAMMDDVLHAFPGEYIHIGGDEVRRMEFLFPGDPDKRMAAMLEHFHFVLGLARNAGRQVLMWGDMPLHHEELMRSLPRDVIICDWHYGPEGSRSTLERYKAEGFRALAAPAIGTHTLFCADPDATAANITAMVGDARDLNLEGFLLTQWEAGFGNGFDLCWPWIAYASEVAAGGTGDDQDTYLARFAADRYGCDGRAFARMHALLSRDLYAAVRCTDAQPRRALVTLRKALYRAADPFADIARHNGIPSNGHQMVWEPSPFHPWLFLRPILNDEMMSRLKALAGEAGELLPKLTGGGRHAMELTALRACARAMTVLAERLELLNAAKQTWHEAAMAQHTDPRAFAAAIEQTIAHLEKVRPGIATLRRNVQEIDAITGLDPGELRWLDIHEQSLDEHLAALRAMRPDDDTLLEFGEFLRRPAHVTPRLTWR